MRGLFGRLSAIQKRYAIPNKLSFQLRPPKWDNINNDKAINKVKKPGLTVSEDKLTPREEHSNDAVHNKIEPHKYDPDDFPVENLPNSWEKSIQLGKAAPSDEFGRKNFVLNATLPDPNSNLYIQIIIDALEEARATDIVVVDVTQKHSYYPDMIDYVWCPPGPRQRKIDFIVYCSGKTARHLSTIAHSVSDKGKKGLIPTDWVKRGLEVDEHKDPIEWRIIMPCGKIVVDIAHPDRRDWKMCERKTICQTTQHAGIFMEDMLTSKGWIRAWDYWTPDAPCFPRNDWESIYAAHRAYGFERVDVLKPEYVVTNQDVQRRYGAEDAFPELSEPEDFDNISPQLRERLRDFAYQTKLDHHQSTFSHAGYEDLDAHDAAVDAEGEEQPNYELQRTKPPPVSDIELDEFIAILKYDRDWKTNVLCESPETRIQKDKEWAEYDARREARIRKYGYYDYVELAHDYRRRSVIFPDGIRTWPEGTMPPALNITPHPENYKGKPRDTYFGPGWYDV
eukprot:TRINITY_DN9257_c0_g1_i2.p1 TRINITY_DN9257_c0_g1~~TRINITY_DN9257_c0_g1_i2.p1  ORF type:complete len:526 (+),score=70.22 TRINITY_DN9257_c0_g1_i2:56-1579(+)